MTREDYLRHLVNRDDVKLEIKRIYNALKDSCDNFDLNPLIYTENTNPNISQMVRYYYEELLDWDRIIVVPMPIDIPIGSKGKRIGTIYKFSINEAD